MQLKLTNVLAQVSTMQGPGYGLWASGSQSMAGIGSWALWNANVVVCLCLFPYSAMQLAACHKFIVLSMGDLGHMSQWRAIMAGNLAGIVSTTVMYPTPHQNLLNYAEHVGTVFQGDPPCFLYCLSTGRTPRPLTRGFPYSFRCSPFLCRLSSILHKPGENLEWAPRSLPSPPELVQCLPGCC